MDSLLDITKIGRLIFFNDLTSKFSLGVTFEGDPAVEGHFIPAEQIAGRIEQLGVSYKFAESERMVFDLGKKAKI